MTKLLETIRIESGRPLFLPYHEARMRRSRAALWGLDEPIGLAERLRPPAREGLWRCRVVYGRQIEQIEYLPYTPRPVRTLKLVYADIDYSLKYLDRSALEALSAQKGEADDILIVKAGLVTDTTIANIAFLRDGRWYTPQHPLLEGTTRARLLKEGRLIPAKITPDDIPRYEGFALLNAMIGFFPVKNGRILF